VVIERSLVVVVVVETAVDAAEAVVFPSVLVGDIAKYAELKEPALLTVTAAHILSIYLDLFGFI
jgi:hypothetical protein